MGAERNACHPARTILICDKQRNGEWEGCSALWFDRESWQFLEDGLGRKVAFGFQGPGRNVG